MKKKILVIGGIAAATLLVGGWALAQSAGHGHGAACAEWAWEWVCTARWARACTAKWAPA